MAYSNRKWRYIAVPYAGSRKTEFFNSLLVRAALPATEVMSHRRQQISQANRARQFAFTLIEILVVVVIVGIISAVAMLSLGILGDDRDLQREARRLSSLIQLAGDEAMMQGRDFGLELVRSGYRFVEHDPLTEQWVELVGDEILRPRQLENEAEFDLYLEDRRIQLDNEAADIEFDEDDEDERRDENLIDDYTPHILIMSSGDISPFELTIFRDIDRTEITITMLPTGEIEIGANDDLSF